MASRMRPGGRLYVPGGALSHGLRVLEYPRVLELVAARATSAPGAEHVRGLRPATGHEAATEALRAADEMVGFLLREQGWTPPPVPDLRAPLRRLEVEGSVLEPGELWATGVLLGSCRAARRDLLRFSDEFPRLAERARGLLEAPEVQERLARSIDRDGEVADSASPELRRLRRQLRARRGELVERLERLAGELPERVRVPDGSVTLRNGRYCIPVRREGRGQVGGIVHDESASRQTLFVEPAAAIEPMNAVRELEMAEAREVRRILEELTGRVRPLASPLRVSLDALAELDSLFARAGYAMEHGGARPELGEESPRGPYRVVEGGHPLLLASGEEVVPFSLELEERESLLLVSGPNAGGKTVLLKAMGLLSAMAQAGIIPPAGHGTRLPTFGTFFAVIGDEQSIEASLSSFGAQLRNLRGILEEADGRSLILLDEVGSHTDPAEGAALAAAVLLRLVGQAGLTVATTHLGELNVLAGETPRVVNASLQFDAGRLRPTFQLRRDRPGRSYALEIAGRLGLPDRVLEEARRRLSGGRRALEELLGELELREAEAEELLRESRRRLEALKRREAELEASGAELELREREVTRRAEGAEREARRKAERYLLDARGQVEETLARLEDRYGASSGAEERQEAATEARREVEEAVRRIREGAPEFGGPGARAELAGLREGAEVRVRSLGRRARVREVRGDRVVVEAGGVRLAVPASDVTPAERPEGSEESPGPEVGSGRATPGPTPGADGEEGRPRLEPHSEVDLRGLRADEVEPVLLSAVDAAILGDLPRLRIIHGKGTGALRRRVREILRADVRIPRFRPGAFDEGGSGVTVIEF